RTVPTDRPVGGKGRKPLVPALALFRWKRVPTEAEDCSARRNRSPPVARRRSAAVRMFRAEKRSGGLLRLKIPGHPEISLPFPHGRRSEWEESVPDLRRRPARLRVGWEDFVDGAKHSNLPPTTRPPTDQTNPKSAALERLQAVARRLAP